MVWLTITLINLFWKCPKQKPNVARILTNIHHYYTIIIFYNFLIVLSLHTTTVDLKSNNQYVQRLKSEKWLGEEAKITLGLHQL